MGATGADGAGAGRGAGGGPGVGVGAGGGPVTSCSSLAATQNVIKPILRQPRRIKLYILHVSALTPQGKNKYLCGVI
jgi:hypothetical protein